MGGIVLQYHQVVKGRFLRRPNRFIAHVETEDGLQICHVKNTGRCRELLVPGAAVYLEKAANSARKTAYDLIAVEKGALLINMDAQAPNRVFQEWAAQGHFLPDLKSIQPEISLWRVPSGLCADNRSRAAPGGSQGCYPGGKRCCPISGRADRTGREAYSRVTAGCPGGTGRLPCFL